MASNGVTASGGEGEDDSSGDEGGGGLGQQRASGDSNRVALGGKMTWSYREGAWGELRIAVPSPCHTGVASPCHTRYLGFLDSTWHGTIPTMSSRERDRGLCRGDGRSQMDRENP